VTNSVFVIKLRSIRGDSIKALSLVLKNLLRRHGFRCVSAHEEFPQQRELPPDNSGK
jgi:hypothetical protein